MENYKITIIATKGMDGITLSEREIRVSEIEDLDIEIGQVRDFSPLDRETRLSIGISKINNPLIEESDS